MIVLKRWLRLAATMVAAILISTVAGFLVAHSSRPFPIENYVRKGGVDLAAGGRLFDKNCSSCHKVKEQSGSGGAPNLHRIGKDAPGRKPELTAAGYLLESIVNPGAFRAPGSTGVMPKNVAEGLNPAEIRNLVGYLASQSATPDFGEIAGLAIPRIDRSAEPARLVSLEQVELGHAIFRGQNGCYNCHEIEARQGLKLLMAPALAAASRHDADYLHRSIVEPSSSISSAYQTVTISLEDGRMISGRCLSRSDAEVQLLAYDAQGNASVTTIAVEEIARDEDGVSMITDSKVSPMPQGFGQALDGKEVDAVVAFIRSLN